MKLPLFILILFFMDHPSGYSQLAKVNGITYIRIIDKTMEPVIGAMVSVNQVRMNECTECPQGFNIPGYYYTSQEVVSSNSAASRFYLQFQHPNFLSFSDSVYSYGAYYAFAPGDDYMYSMNKCPVLLDRTLTFTVVSDNELLQKYLTESHGSIFTSFDPCPYDFNHGSRFRVAIVKHDNEKDQVKFREDCVWSYAYASRRADIESSFGLSDLISVDIKAHPNGNAEVLKVAEKLRQDGKIIRYNFDNAGFTTNTKLAMYLPKGKEYTGNSILEEVMATGLFSMPSQSTMMVACPE